MTGIAGGTLWSSTRLYVSKIAMVHAKIAGEDPVKMTGIYFGIFFLSSSAMVIGNAAGALINILKIQFEEQQIENIYDNRYSCIIVWGDFSFVSKKELKT